MKTRILARTLVIALAMTATLTMGSSKAFGRDKDGQQGSGSLTPSQSKTVDSSEHGNDLGGVWEEIDVPAETICGTDSPLPDTPIIRALLSFNEGGTMYVEDTAPFDGPYRSTGAGIWKRTSNRNYLYVNVHYAFNPDKTFTLTIKQRSALRLSRDGNSFTERGTFDVIEPGGTVVYAGCFTATAHRLTF